ncbi:MAG: DUF6188 family protein [Pirellulales bacterium]
MSPAPQNATLQKLRNVTLESLCFGRYTVQFGFDRNYSLRIEASFRFGSHESIANSPIFDFPLQETQLVRLLGQSVVQVFCEEDATLHLRFSNNDELIVYANDEQYEAYTFDIDGPYVV